MLESGIKIVSRQEVSSAGKPLGISLFADPLILHNYTVKACNDILKRAFTIQPLSV